MKDIIQLLSIMGTAFVVGFSGAVMPGPVLAVTIGAASRRGRLAGPLIVLGHGILEAALVAAMLLGLATFLKEPAILEGVRLVGGGMMTLMGWDMIRSARRLSLTLEGTGPGSMHPVAAGILVSLSNPYWLLWWVTIGMSYVVMGAEYGVLGVLFFFVGHILSDLVWYTAVSMAVAKGRHFMSDEIYRWLIRGCGAFLLSFAAWFILSAFRNVSTGAG